MLKLFPFIFFFLLPVQSAQSCSELSLKHCIPCEGIGSPYSEQDARAQLALLKGWSLSSSGNCLAISRSWIVRNFTTALDFFAKITQLSEEEGHHPDMHLTAYRNVKIDLYTHAICGLSQNDFILAAKINLIDVELHQHSLSAPVSRIGKVHMLSGMISSGKSTYAQQLVSNKGAVSFSPDEWILDFYGAEFPVERFQEHGDIVKAHIWSIAQQFLSRGIDVVLDFSFWTKSDRQAWREKVNAFGAEVQLYYLPCSAEILRERLRARNARVSSGIERHFFISEQTFEGWIGLLEPAEPDEHAIIVDSCTNSLN